MAKNGVVKEGELHRVLHDRPRKIHKLSFPEKLKEMERRFGIATRFNANVLSLNKARTCVVHRLGVVSALDIDEKGVLKITFQHARFLARGQHTGQELVLDRPGKVTSEDSILEMHFVETECQFKLGERVRLQAHELYDTICTLWRFGLAAAQEIEVYGNSLGIQLTMTPTET